MPEGAASLRAHGGFILHTSFRSAGSVEEQADQKLDSTSSAPDWERCHDALLSACLHCGLRGEKDLSGSVRGGGGLTELCYTLARQLGSAVVE